MIYALGFSPLHSSVSLSLVQFLLLGSLSVVCGCLLREVLAFWQLFLDKQQSIYYAVPASANKVSPWNNITWEMAIWKDWYSEVKQVCVCTCQVMPPYVFYVCTGIWCGRECACARVSQIYVLLLCKNVCVWERVCVCGCHIVASLSCDPGPHVQPIRANQKAVIRAWRGDGGSVAVGEF